MRMKTMMIIAEPLAYGSTEIATSYTNLVVVTD